MLIKHQAPVTRGFLFVGGWVDLVSGKYINNLSNITRHFTELYSDGSYEDYDTKGYKDKGS